MSRDFLPRQDVAIRDASDRVTNPWYVWMQGIERILSQTAPDAASLQAQIDQLRQEIADLPGGEVVTGIDSVSAVGPLADGSYAVRLVNDLGSPPAFTVYGVGEDGTKGWHALSGLVNAGMSLVAGIDWGDLNYLGELPSTDDLPGSGTLNDAYLIEGSVYVWEYTAWVNRGAPPGAILLTLVNDEEAPGDTHYYGTDAAGDKGFHAISDTVQAASGELTKAVDGDGVTTFGLADVVPTTGGTLQKYGFDAKGRRDEEDAATTDDLPEGASNLYFTAARVLAVVLSGLSTATNSAITAADSVLAAFGKLQAQITSLAASLSGYVPTSRTISTTAPLAGGGNLSANRTLSITAATTSAAGSMSAADKTKLDGIAADATVGANWSVNLSNIPANITSWAGITPASKIDVAPITVSDWDADIGSGNNSVEFGRGLGAAANDPSNAGFLALAIKYNSNAGFMLGGAFAANELWYRRRNGAMWEPYVRVWDSGNLADSGWIAPTLGGSWSNAGGGYSTAGYRKFGDLVRLRGVLTGGTTTSGTVLFTLPSGYRPALSMEHPIYCSGSVAVGEAGVRVMSNGQVTIAQAAGDISLDSISFFTG